MDEHRGVSEALTPTYAIPLGESLALAGFLCFVFWDFYVPSQGFRPLDIVGTILVVVGLCSSQVRGYASKSVGYSSLTLCAGACFAAAAGVLADPLNIRAAVGVCAGAVLFVIFSFWPLSRIGVLKVVNIALKLNLAAFWLQFFWYFATGVVLNYHAALGGKPRVFAPYFRAAGLYLEPSNFALMSISLLALRYYVWERLDFLFWVVIVTVLSSLSLWGLVGALTLLLLRARRELYAIALTAVLIAAIAAFLIVTDYWREIYVLDRLSRLATDPSANARYEALTRLTSSDLWTTAFWFGEGVRSDYAELGANSLSYLYTSVGVIGSIAIAVGLAVRAKRGWRIYVVGIFLLMLTAAYLWTFMYWWCWLAMLGRRDLRASTATLGNPLPAGDGTLLDYPSAQARL